MWYLILMAIAYLAVNFLLWCRVIILLKYANGFFSKKWVAVVFTLIYLFFLSSIGIWVLFDDPHLAAVFKYINNIWIGVFIYAVLFVAIAEVVTFILWITKKVRKGYDNYRKYILCRGVTVICLVIGFSLYGIIHYQDINVKHYEADIAKTSKAGDSMKIVLVADTHLGYSVGNDMIEKTVKLINAQDPDLVVFSGDIVDNDYYSMEDADKIAETLASINSKYGVYGCYGNHDVKEKLIGGFTVSLNEKVRIQPELDEFVRKAGIKILEDQTETVAGDIVLVGRYDASKPNCSDRRASISMLTANIDKNNPIICIDHQPSELQQKSDAGIDIDLAGHTHNGQIFPGNLTINMFWDNAYGLFKVGDMYSIVTSGVGVWGSAMRVGTDAEIVCVDVNFK